MSNSEPKKSLNHPEIDFLGGQTTEAATEEVEELLLDGKNIEEATEEVIKEFGGRMNNDEIRKLFD
ncbi:MAG: hypothetical protein WCO49_11495 [Nostocales cyanobacterium ELA608]|jgi:hypothetical protein|nr:MAG: hypothetical protein HEQ12_08750 [Aphanizomenon flos-aquae DEX188]